ncbi:MAG: hybrid sensor histidine kinase/response regulator [Desulfobacteraceae bacterium]|nr:hybrid sensor histidine kinase/response regulator [Desulfobacteraceae bacterium]
MNNQTVLFVDDEQFVLSSLKRLLRNEPYRCLFAGGGKEALDFLEKENVHVTVSDLSMPGMDGLTLLDKVGQKYPDIVRLVLSALTDSDTVLEAINRGQVYRYIAKPWNKDELKVNIRQALEIFDLQEEKRDLLRKIEEHNKLLEKMVEKRTSQLLAIQSKAEIGKYASQIVHNLNNPLQAIYNALDLADFVISDKNPDLKKLNKYLKVINSNAENLKEIISGILIHARNDRINSSEQIDINKIVKKQLSFFNLDIAYKTEIEKEVALSDTLPCIFGNPIHIKQIIDNLIKNAIDAMQHSAKKTLMIKTRFEDNNVFMDITDTGEGIAQEDLDRIFSPDFTTKPVGKGTGLGLASVKTMVEGYNGEIQVESKKGQGTTFTIKLPVKKQSHAHCDTN